MQKVAVLGANGVVGKSLIDELLKENLKSIKSISRSIPHKTIQGVEYIALDIRQEEALKEELKEIDTVFLTVGIEYKASIWEVEWPKIMQSVIKACSANNSKLIFFDNVYSYGIVNGKITEDLDLKPVSKKGLVRLKLVQMLENAHKELGLQYIICKSGEFYGPGVKNSSIYNGCLENMLVEKPAFWIGDLNTKRTYTYVPDAVRAMTLLAKDSSAFLSPVWHMPTGKPLTGNEYVQIIEKILNKKVKVSSLGLWYARFLSLFLPILKELLEMYYQFTNDYIFDSSKFIKKYPEFKITDYEVGLRESINNYKNN